MCNLSSVEKVKEKRDENVAKVSETSATLRLNSFVFRCLTYLNCLENFAEMRFVISQFSLASSEVLYEKSYLGIEAKLKSMPKF